GNGIDEDCNGTPDDGCQAACPDNDGDDYAVCSGGCQLPQGKQCGDCDGTNTLVHPGAPETCGNGIDDDCNGQHDEGCQAVCPDNDGDGYAVCGGDCQLPQGKQCGDCDDTNPLVHPGAPEICNGIDDNCDGQIDEGGDSLCNDQNDCTADTCGGSSGCDHATVPDGAQCSDGNACTRSDACLSGVCVG